MSLDAIVAQLRELSADATRAAKNPAPDCSGTCPHAVRAAMFGARFTELDVVLSYNGRLPKAWASAFVPPQRDPR